MEREFSFAVKSFIVNPKGRILIVKRRPNDPHAPGSWEIPGGRIGFSEDPFSGLKRETMEETGLGIEIGNPLKVMHFTRDDGQMITMISFLCKPLSEAVRLSEEHTEYKWVGIKEYLNMVHPSFREEAGIYEKHFCNG